MAVWSPLTEDFDIELSDEDERVHWARQMVD